MRPCIRCYAAIGNADDPCPECGAPQSRPGPAAAQAGTDDPAPDRESRALGSQMLGLEVVGLLTALAIVGLSFLAFGPTGIIVAMVFFLFCGILWGVVTSGGF